MDFNAVVIERSKTKPVLVDFWSPGCGPCLFVENMLARIWSDQKERWDLVTVNVEEDPEIARTYKVWSNPTVKLFVKGQEVSMFTGALPRNVIEQWLDDNIPNRERDLLGDLVFVEDGWPDSVFVSELDSFLKEFPKSELAIMYKVKHLALEDLDEAKKLFEKVTGISCPQLHADLNSLLELLGSDYQEKVSAIQEKKSKEAFIERLDGPLYEYNC